MACSSTETRARKASSSNFRRAAAKRTMPSIDVTWADSVTQQVPAPRRGVCVVSSQFRAPLKSASRDLSLLQIFVNPIGLAQQERDVLIIGFEKVGHHLQIAVKLFAETLIFLVAPCGAQSFQLACQGRRLFRQAGIEFLEHLSKSAQFIGVDDRLGHKDTGNRTFGPRSH